MFRGLEGWFFVSSSSSFLNWWVLCCANSWLPHNVKYFWLYFIYVYTISDGFIRPVLVHSTADVTSTCRLQDPTNCDFEEQNLHSFYSKHCVLLPNSSGHTHCLMLKVRTNSTFFLNILPLLESFSLEINFLLYDLQFTHKVPVPHDCVSIGHPARLSGSRGWDRC